MGPGGRPEARRATGSTQKCCLFAVQSWWWQKNWTISEKMDFGPKTAFLARNSAFFHATPMKPPFLRVRRKLQGACKSPFLAQKWPENQIFMLSIVLHGIVWYCMEFLCILWYPIVFMSFHCIVWYCMVLYYILRYCMVLHYWVSARGLYLVRHLSTGSG